MTKIVEVERLRDKITKISGNQCNYYSEACIVLLEDLAHKSGVLMAVNGDVSTTYSLLWSTNPIVGGWKAHAKLIENAATAIAFFLVAEETDYTIIEESPIGTGVDYWLGYKEGHKLYNEDNFINARLEISGIRDNTREVLYRLNRKLKQVTPTDSTGLPAYIAIAEFGTPVAILYKK